VERWLELRRDAWGPRWAHEDTEWHAVNELLEEYRRAADAGVPLAEWEELGHLIKSRPESIPFRQRKLNEMPPLEDNACWGDPLPPSAVSAEDLRVKLGKIDLSAPDDEESGQ
jgi:hypothetical protein